MNNSGHALSPFAGEGNCLNDLADLQALPGQGDWFDISEKVGALAAQKKC